MMSDPMPDPEKITTKLEKTITIATIPYSSGSKRRARTTEDKKLMISEL